MSTRRRVAGSAVGVIAAALIIAAEPATGGPAAIPPGTVPPAAVEQVPQLMENGAVAARVALTGTRQRRVCFDGATWLRPRFTQLSLRGSDSVRLTGSAGGSLTLTARNWPGKAFHTRAFPGDCVMIQPSFADPSSTFTIDAVQAGSVPLAAATVTVAAAGDLCGTACNQTADLVEAMAPNAVITMGDNAYNSGTLSEFNNNYDPYWGQFKPITYPTPGNHEYYTSGAGGYFDYFGSRAGERGKGYYSFDVGDWHFVALNSNISMSAGSAQETWLRNDLAANTKPCTAAYWHHPRFAVGNYGDNSSVRPLYQALYDNQADLVLNGHDHNYVRFAMSRPDGTRDDVNGVRELLIGTGGRGLYTDTSNSAATVEARNNNTHGVGKLTLTATGYRAEFVPVAGRTFTDSVTGTCKRANTEPDFGVGVDPASVTVAQGGSAGTTVTVSSIGGFSAGTSLSVSGLPSGVSASFSPASVTPPADGSATSTLTLSASASAATGTVTVTVSGTSGSVTRSAPLTVTVDPDGVPPGECSGANADNVDIPDLSTVESLISISGCSGNASATSAVEVHIVHTYIGDLVVSLVAPDGSTYTLHNRAGGSANDINETYQVDLSSEPRNGTWRLRVRDAAGQDVGYIDSWTLTL